MLPLCGWYAQFTVSAYQLLDYLHCPLSCIVDLPQSSEVLGWRHGEIKTPFAVIHTAKGVFVGDLHGELNRRWVYPAWHGEP